MILAITSLLLTLVIVADSQSCGRDTKFTSFQAELDSGETIDGFAKCLRGAFEADGSLNRKKYDYVVSDVAGPSKWSISTKADGFGCLANDAYTATADNGEICKTIDAAQKQIQSGRRQSTAIQARRIIVIVVWLPCCIIVVIIIY